ncbi:hypothetical protein AXF42_Ash020913 [Apostasia shenzhenica]|uniref:Uncharacterized protein n=1 Tax=Apostasia shenzhenica TaxID=1088818 RepID=A0A2H9ZUG9_9ASPA|nr:hypothetical protein AXF42_Ash020913 [Apostasia shenzhenica]
MSPSYGSPRFDPSPNPNLKASNFFGKAAGLGYHGDHSVPRGEANPRAVGYSSNDPIQKSASFSEFNFGKSDDFDGRCDSDEEFDIVEAVDEVDFGVLDLFREKGTGESRHPLVNETCRLIGLRHAWNPKLERELRRLLRSLKPPQVSAVLRAQPDARLAVEVPA